MDYFLVDYENIGEAGLKGIQNLTENAVTVIFYSEHADKISFDMHQILCNCKCKVEFRKAMTGKKNALDFQLSTYLGYLVASHPDDYFYLVSKDTGYRVVMDFWKDSNIKQIDYIGRANLKVQDLQSEVVMTAKEPFCGVVKLHDSEDKEETPEENLPAKDESVFDDAVLTPVKADDTFEAAAEDEKTADNEKSAENEKTADNEKSAQTGNSAQTENPARNDTQPAAKRPYRQGRRKKSVPVENPVDEYQPSEELKAALAQLIEDEDERDNIGRFIVKYKTKQGVNNAIVKIYGTEKAGELYKKIKPLLKDKKGK